ncbi:MAG: protein kinase, partial [Actinomycetales bacterium]
MTLFGTGNGAPQDTQSDVFAVTERIGEGASAVVYRARHTTLGIDVALKIWRRGLTERQRVRFLSECRLHWRLSDHPNVVRMLWADVRQDGCPWIASELYTESLADRLAERGPLPLSEALHLADGLLRGLAAMHHEGLVHRDVKPANVMLDGDRAALGDFGTAMASTDMTEDRAAGTSRYVAPELLGGASPSARSDVYSAGVTIRETIGAQPTPAVAAVLVRATSYLPDDRPENAEQLRRALTAAGGLATDRADVGPVAGAGSGAGGGAAPWTAGAAARPRRGRRTSSRMRGAGLAVLAVSLVSAAALAVTLLVALPRDDGTPSSTPAGAPPADIPGRLVAWGAGGDEAVAAVDAGQTGQVGQAGRSWSPRPVTGPWADAARVAGAAVVSTAGDRACAVDGNGRLACWSADGSSRPEQPPLPESPALFADVDVGGESACGIDDQAELWCWGGPGSPDPTLATPATRVVGGPWQEVSVGDTHTCAVTMTGRLACWGDNRLWQLGGQETPGTTSPVFVHTLRTWRLVSAGPDFTCGIATDGLFCWGVDLVVRATEERVEARRPPTRIEDGAWATVSAGRAHACAVAEDGVLFCWGDDSQGQLSPRGSGGDGGQPGTVPTAPWRAVSAGGDSTCGVMVDGTLWCWGSGGTRQVGAGTRWADVEVAARHACAGAEDGTVACWDVTVDST